MNVETVNNFININININIQLFEKAAKIMHKNFVSNGAFRQLVRPLMASGIDMERGQSFNLNSNQVGLKKKKGCCSK